MAEGRRIDWRAVPRRFRAWRALPTWRKLLWIVHRGVMMAVLYVGFAVGILWYNEPTLVEGIAAGQQSAWALAGLLAGRLELLAILLLLVPAVIAGVLLPHTHSWR